MKILLIEDEINIGKFVKQGLTEEGYIVDHIDNGVDGASYSISGEYDLIILDILLPGKNGIEVCKEVREYGCTTPILMLTALDSIDDKVNGLDAGADDYLSKPFAFKELLARIRALSRRPKEVMERYLKIEDLTLDTVTHTVKRGHTDIELTAKEYALLEFLMRNPNRVLSRTQILEKVWNQDFYSESNVVDVYIRYLRNKIDKGFEKQLITTERGFGYKIS